MARIVWMQILAILPILGFLCCYTEGIVFGLGTLVLGGLLVLIGYRVLTHKPPLVLPFVVLLMGSFYLYSFWGLGSMHTPQTAHILTTHQSITVFDFASSVAVDKVCYYVGVDKNVKFSLERQTAQGWKHFYSYDEDYPYSFRWRCVDTGFESTKVLWRITSNEMMLSEVHFSFEGMDIPYTSTKKYLNDEAELAIDTSYYSGMFFDEIYFARTAYEFMYDETVYENTHPYLGKVLILSGIKAFGMTPFGWRFMNVLFAGILVFMAYYFAIQLFGTPLYGFVSGFLMTYSFMHLAQARMGLVDTFGVLFVVIAYYYLYVFIQKQRLGYLWLSAVFLGLGIGVKWSALFAVFGFVAIALYLLWIRYPLQKRFRGVRLLGYGFIAYGGLSFVVYILSFWELYSHTGTLQSIIDYNLNMYHYHASLEATHPYSSPWWSWMLDMKPMGYYKVLDDGVLSSINALGNPALFWLGIVAILYLCWVVIVPKSIEASVILFGFMALYLPYMFVGRLLFIYHFYYALPFVLLGIVYMMRDSIERFAFMSRLWRGYLALVALLFLGFYPVLSGYPIENSTMIAWLQWFDGWWF
ncbi:MAG: glycosyltransferase family 39 protein [Sulfurovum sp.]|nr:glycosyltransferase family 39 protein [Sulfurovum sp.]